MISTQELRRDVEGIRSLTPQPEDPERSLDPTSKEDPDIKVELIDGVFHQLSMDNALVAITADYPGLFPASQVTTTEVLTPLFDGPDKIAGPFRIDHDWSHGHVHNAGGSAAAIQGPPHVGFQRGE